MTSTLLPDNKDIRKYLSVLNGVKGVGMLLLIMSQTYYFIDYAPIDNHYDVKAMKDYVIFTFVPASVVVVPVLIFLAGFL